ncbi:MAG: VTT domain-containing protein [Oscillospiraceae bacterium]|nr:VTT domain-containing protein [Oscillospiraceae bacterium]
MNKKFALTPRRRRALVNLAGVFMLAASGVFIVLMFLLDNIQLQEWYMEYHYWMEQVRDQVMNLPDIWLILFAVILLYAVRSFIPIPIFIMAFITGAYLEMYLSLLVNFAGLFVLFTIRYFFGRKMGGGAVEKILHRQSDIHDYLENGRGSKGWLLFVMRLIPNFALNPISQIYGSMGFDYTDFILISLLGVSPKLFIYTVLGRNVAQPLSVPFIFPLIIIFALLGVVTLVVNFAMHKHSKNKSKEAQAKT